MVCSDINDIEANKMKIKITSHTNFKGEIEYHFTGIDNIAYFDIIGKILQNKFNFVLKQHIDGIWVKEDLFEGEEKKIFLVFHEDTGNYLTSKTPQKDKELMKLAENIISVIMGESTLNNII
jgi:hypothetical protein